MLAGDGPALPEGCRIRVRLGADAGNGIAGFLGEQPDEAPAYNPVDGPAIDV